MTNVTNLNKYQEKKLIKKLRSKYDNCILVREYNNDKNSKAISIGYCFDDGIGMSFLKVIKNG